MRTETHLREAFDALAARAPAAEAVLDRLVLPTPPPHRAPRRRLVLVAAAVAVAIVAAIAIPLVLSRHSAPPADARAAGNWNLIHRVGLAGGWTVAEQLVGATSERTVVRVPGGAGNDDQTCTVEVYAAGAVTPPVSTRDPVDVNGHPARDLRDRFGSNRPADQDVMGSIYWEYRPGSWAYAGCASVSGDADPDLAVDVARRVQFTPTPLRLPFRLPKLPAGYAVGFTLNGHSGDTDDPAYGVELRSAGGDVPAPMDIVLTPGQTPVQPGVPGYETATVAGHPAVLKSDEGRLCLNLRGWTLCISTPAGQPGDLSSSMWPAGRRELLVRTAESLVVADHLDDPNSWPDATSALR